MLHGKTKMTINKETIKVALQEYFDGHMVGYPKIEVSNVKPKSDYLYVVSLKEIVMDADYKVIPNKGGNT